MAGCKTWQGKLTWSFPRLKGLPRWARGERAIVLKKKRKRESWCERAQKTKHLPSQESRVQQEEDNHPAQLQAFIPRKRTIKCVQLDPIKKKTGYYISDF